MKVKTWKIIDRGDVPEGAATVPYTCPCGYEAELPVKGRPIAQIHSGIVFDNNERGFIPKIVQCRKCRRILTTEVSDVR